VARAKAHGDVASELMTEPVVTIQPGTSLAAAAKLMEAQHVKRLPVVDDLGRLIGIVARRDLLKPHLRPDPEIREEVVEQVLRGVMMIDPLAVEVDLTDGVVTLRGTVDRRSTATITARLTAAVPGVVSVVDQLRWDVDDTEDGETGFYRTHPFSTSTRQPQ
jgi:CBS-domain-containing membrane protein